MKKDSNITSFDELRIKKDLYENSRDQDTQEHSHGFSPLHIEEYTAKIETQIDANVETDQTEGREMKEKSYEDTDFLGTRDLEEQLNSLDDQVGNLESLNIFGVPL